MMTTSTAARPINRRRNKRPLSKKAKGIPQRDEGRMLFGKLSRPGFFKIAAIYAQRAAPNGHRGPPVTLRNAGSAKMRLILWCLRAPSSC